MSKVKTKVIHLTYWSITGHPTDNPFVAPELRSFCLHGEVYGHPVFKDGDRITTSPIKAVEGNKVTVESGKVYKLGKPCGAYVKWCRENKVHVPTRKEPIRVR